MVDINKIDKSFLDNWPQTKDKMPISVGSNVYFENQHDGTVTVGLIEAIEKDYSNIYEGGYKVTVGPHEVGNHDCYYLFNNLSMEGI